MGRFVVLDEVEYVAMGHPFADQAQPVWLHDGYTEEWHNMRMQQVAVHDCFLAELLEDEAR